MLRKARTGAVTSWSNSVSAVLAASMSSTRKRKEREMTKNMKKKTGKERESNSFHKSNREILHETFWKRGEKENGKKNNKKGEKKQRATPFTPLVEKLIMRHLEKEVNMWVRRKILIGGLLANFTQCVPPSHWAVWILRPTVWANDKP